MQLPDQTKACSCQTLPLAVFTAPTPLGPFPWLCLQPPPLAPNPDCVYPPWPFPLAVFTAPPLALTPDLTCVT